MSRTALPAALLALALCAGCYNGLEGNTPFNCTKDKQCPSPLVCRSNQCQMPDAGVIPCEDGGLCSGGGVCLLGYGCATVESCDPVAQNCHDKELSRCNYVSWYLLDGGYDYVPQCVPLTPDAGRLLDAGAATGDPSAAPCGWLGRDYNLDTCPKGYTCSDWGDGPHCRSMCSFGSGCAGNLLCFADTASFGECVAGCSDDTDCGAQQTCRPSLTVAGGDILLCEEKGSGTEGSSCTYNVQCGQDLLCISSVCRTLCDVPFSSCTSSQTCSNFYFGNQESAYGYCH